MRNALLTCIAFCLASLPGVAGEKAARPPSGAVQHFTKLRLAYAKRPDFTPYWEDAEEREKAEEAVNGKQYAEGIKLCEAWLAKCPVDARMHQALAICHARQGNPQGFFRHMQRFYGLLASITSSGTGKTEDSPFKVISVSEEYLVLGQFGARATGQALLNGGIDRVQCLARGEKMVFYFDASIPFAHGFGKKQEVEPARE